MDETSGIVGDRRRNPFPSMNDTEYALFLLTIRQAVNEGVAEAMSKYQKDNCLPHQENTKDVMETLYGHDDDPGLVERVRNVERAVGWAAKSLWVAIGAVIIAVVGLGLGQIGG